MHEIMPQAIETLSHLNYDYLTGRRDVAGTPLAIIISAS